MIYARELRIGNLFQTRANDIRGVDIKELTRIQRMPYLYKPITITNHWLVRLGAIEIPKNQFHVTLYCFKDSESCDWCVGYVEGAWHLFNGRNDAFCNGVNHSELKYIHKLQNLIFEVANVEITIK